MKTPERIKRTAEPNDEEIPTNERTTENIESTQSELNAMRRSVDENTR